MTQPTPAQMNELMYLAKVQPLVHAMLDQVEEDTAKMGVEPQWFRRAVWVWAMQKHADILVIPDWMDKELDRIQSERREDTGDG